MHHVPSFSRASQLFIEGSLALGNFRQRALILMYSHVTISMRLSTDRTNKFMHIQKISAMVHPEIEISRWHQ